MFYSNRSTFIALGLFLVILCSLVFDPVHSVKASNPATVQEISLTSGFVPDTKLLFAIVKENEGINLIVKELFPLRFLAQFAINIVDYEDEDPVDTPFLIPPDQAKYLIVGSQLNLYVINFRRNADGSVAVSGPTSRGSLGDPAQLGQPTAIAVSPRPEDPVDPWVAVGTNSGNVILTKSGMVPHTLNVDGPVVDLIVVRQVGHLAFGALVNRRDGQHLVGIQPPPDDGLPEQIVFDLALSGPPPDDDLIDLAIPPPDDGLTEPAPVHVIAADRTRSIYRLTIPARPDIGGSFSIQTLGRAPTPIKQVAAGSLALLPWDGSGVLYDAAFEIAQTELSGTLRTIFGSSVDLSPQTFRLSSAGKFVTAVIEAADGKVADIVASTIKLEINGGSVGANSAKVEFGDVDGDGELDLTVKFDRHRVFELLPREVSSILVVTRWNSTDGTEACASAEVRISR